MNPVIGLRLRRGLRHDRRSGLLRQRIEIESAQTEGGPAIYREIKGFISRPRLLVVMPYECALVILQPFFFARELLEIFLVVLRVVGMVHVARAWVGQLETLENGVLGGRRPDEPNVVLSALALPRASRDERRAALIRSANGVDPAAAIRLHEAEGLIGMMAADVDRHTLDAERGA